MDTEFLKQLDEQVSFVGTSELWQREVAGRLVWFSPIPYPSQVKVQETLTNADLGNSAILETKRITLAHAIVGIDQLDLRPWRFAGAVFPSVDPRTKASVKVELSTFMYHKMTTWGAEFIDNAFDVFADLMESYKTDSLKNVKFENKKDPLTELAELEARAGEIRTQLGMPFLIEATKPGDEEDMAATEQDHQLRVPSPAPEEASPAPPPPVMDFDPFAPVQSHPAYPEGRVEPPPPPDPPAPPAPPAPPPVVTVPVPRAPATVPHTVARQVTKQQPTNPAFGKEGSTPENPFPASASVPSEVVEAPAQRIHVAPPQVDRVVGNVNPRFRPAGR